MMRDATTQPSQRAAAPIRRRLRGRHATPQRIASICLLLIGAVLALIPLFWMIRSSFMTLPELYIFPPLLWSRVMRWANYRDAVTVVNFPLYFRNTMLIMVPVLVGTVVTSSMAAYAFARLQFPFMRFWFVLVLGSLMLPYAVTMLPTFLLWSRLGAVNTFLPLTVPAWLGGGAFNIFMLRQFFLTIPKELEEAAIIDGAGYFGIYYRIMLPLVKPALVVVALFTFLAVWNDFLNPLIYLNNEQLYTLALGLLQFKGTYSAQWQLLMAGSTILVIPPVLMFLLGQKYFIEGITLSGMKL
jgi:multiple sugar transport system permease protein